MILIADEDREIRQLLRQVLEKNNYIVICASSGMEILKLVQFQPQLIILDVYKPLPSLKGNLFSRRVDGLYNQNFVPTHP